MNDFESTLVLKLIDDSGYTQTQAESMVINGLVGNWEDVCERAEQLAFETVDRACLGSLDLVSFTEDYSCDCEVVTVDGEDIYIEINV